MKHFKKRTLALVLASVVTVVGAFGAENYKNSLMALKFDTGSGGSVNAVLYTKEAYTGNISPTRMSADTYVIMLPDVSSDVPSGIDLGSSIKSVDIKTMPYTSGGNGYTKITIKTRGAIPLYVKNDIYVSTSSKEPEKLETTAPQEGVSNEETTNNQPNKLSKEEQNLDRELLRRNQQKQDNSIRSSSGVAQTGSADINRTLKEFQSSSPQNNPQKPSKKSISVSDLKQQEKTSNHQEIIYMILGVAFVIATSIFLMLKTRDKLVEITGERTNYDVNDEPKNNNSKKKEKPKINATINNLDKRYTRPITMPVNPADQKIPGPEQEEPETVQEVENVVDLDELLNEQNKQGSSEKPRLEAPVNDALEDFLSSYNFETEDYEEKDNSEEKEDSEKGINEELYNKYINENDIEFTKDDVEKIETLMNSEISDDTLRNASEYMDSSEKNKKPSPLEILEKLVTQYTVEQNITFTKEDIEALYKLISVEIDNDFITDLRTNPSRMQEMQDEIARQKTKPHKASELLTLNVKDMLPDLSEALKKQGGRRIESEVKPQVVYYSEGYDVSTLKLNTDLPDLSKEINNEEAYKSRPSDDIQYVDTSYDVQKMSISNELPDLEDMLKHPEKYETPEPEEVEVDEEALLRNITNVTFKPFDDGTREFEVLNDIGPAPTVSDMQAEFNKFGDNFEIINEEEYIQTEKDTDKNDFETLYDGKFVDLDTKTTSGTQFNSENQNFKTSTEELNIKAEDDNELLSENNNIQEELKEYDKADELKIIPSENESDDLAEYPETEADKLLSMIKNYESKREAKRAQRRNIQTANSNETNKTNNIKVPDFCIYEDEKYSIINASYFAENIGCYLAKNERGYSILGFVGDRIFKIKYYEKLDNEKLQSRLAEKLDDGTVRYIVRIGIHKFIMNVKKDDMEFVMDLC